MISQTGRVVSLRVSMTDYFALTAEAGQSKVFLSDLLWAKISEHSELKVALEESSTSIANESERVAQERATFENDISELTGVLEESSKEKVALQNEVFQLQGAIEDLNHLEIQKRALETETADLKKRLDTVQKEAKTLKKDNADLDHNLTLTLQRIENQNVTENKLSEELYRLRNKNAAFEDNFKKSIQKSDSLKTSFDGEKKVLKSTILSLEGDLKKAIQKYEKQILEKSEESEALKGLLTSSQSETKKATQKATNVTLELENAKKENTALLQVREAVSKQNKVLSKQVETLQDKRMTDRIEHNANIDELHRQVQSWVSYVPKDAQLFEDAKSQNYR